MRYGERMEPNLRKVLDVSRDFITLINRNYQYEFVNEAYLKQLGRSRKEVEGKTVQEIWGERRFIDAIRKPLDECLAGQESHDIDRFQFGDGFKYIQVSYYPYREGDQITHVMVYSHDLTTMKEMESRLQDMEFKDRATGLFNRRSFDIVLDMELEKARRSLTDPHRGLLLLSLGNLTQINARYGAQIGDLLLESIGGRIKEALRAADFVFRLEGRDLAVLLSSLDPDTNLERVAETVLGWATFPFQHQDAVIQVRCHIGIARFPDDGNDKETLYRCALSALSEARDTDEPIVAFNQELYRQSLRKERLRSDIRKALVESQFEPYFQPIVDRDGNLVGAEALIRWNHPKLGWISPTEFIPVAEESGDTHMIGRWMLFRVCAALKKWKKRLAGRYLSVNLSAKEFSREFLVDDLKKILETEKIPPSSLKLEITETQVMTDWCATIQKIEKLQALGLDILVDDFGSGYSSLAYLKKIPAQTIKIDKVFIDHLAENKDDRIFLAGMISMIASRDRKIIVEGVETQEQFEILKGFGVRYFQGFLFSKPVPAPEFEKLL